MYLPEFKYNSDASVEQMANKIKTVMNNFDIYQNLLPNLVSRFNTFFKSDIMIDKLIK